jgi:DNA-binding PadR family transcriptional regulator
LILKPGLLILLAENDSHGYDLLDRLKEMGYDPECLEPSMVYRDLRDMEDEGLIRSFWDEEDSKGPRRRVYQLQDAGRERLEDWLNNLNTLSKQIVDLGERYQQIKDNDQSQKSSKG